MPDAVSSLANAVFLGRVLPDLDPNSQQRYKIHIPLLMRYMDDKHGIWCHNYTAGGTMSKSQTGEYGSSTPLQPGTFVMVRFMENDPNSGFIERTVSHAEKGSDTKGQDSTETINRPEDRDRRTVLYKTPNRSHTTYINEETKEEPNSYYEVHGRDANPGRETVRRVNEDGMHMYTRANTRKRVLLNDNNQIDKDQSFYVKGNQKTNIDGEQDVTVASGRFITVNGNEDHYVKSNFVLEVNGSLHVSCSQETNIWASKSVNVHCDEGAILLQCKSAYLDNAQGTKPKSEVVDLGPSETSEYKSGLGETCTDAEKSTENKGPRYLEANTMNPEGKLKEVKS